jgi:diketogulonate reductase-like aldo/keto reductase
MRTTLLSDGTPVPIIGQGTFKLGESADSHKAEIAILKGISFGMTLIDTAEDYANGGAEALVGHAIHDCRDRVFLVTKVLPRNASRTEMKKACARSLERLRTDTIDLYLLHWWRNVVPSLNTTNNVSLEEIVAGFEELKTEGKIRHWGVSNFVLNDMRALFAIPGGTNCAAHQFCYNLANRYLESDGSLAWCQEHKVLVMAHSPLGSAQGLLNHPVLRAVAERHDATPAQIALAWIIRHAGVIVIPKADRPSHTRQNANAIHIQLTQEDYADLERAFPL